MESQGSNIPALMGDANNLVNSIKQPNFFTSLVSKFNFLKTKMNTKYLFMGVVGIVVVVGLVLFYNFKKNKKMRSQLNNNMGFQKMTNVPEMEQKLQKKYNKVVEKPKRQPEPEPESESEESVKEPDEISKLNLTRNEIKEIEDELDDELVNDDN